MPESVPYVPDGQDLLLGRLGWFLAMTMNPDRRMTFAYVMNRMGAGTTGTDRTNRYGRLFYEALD